MIMVMKTIEVHRLIMMIMKPAQLVYLHDYDPDDDQYFDYDDEHTILDIITLINLTQD